jgi:hypothetical protein
MYLLLAFAILLGYIGMVFSQVSIYRVIEKFINQQNYLLDRIQTGSAQVAKVLNAKPESVPERKPATVNFGTAEGLEVE